MRHVFVLVWSIPLGFLVAIGWIWFGRRPTPERFGTAQGLVLDPASLPLVRSALHRTYVGRVVGALAGALGVVAFGWALGAIVALPFLGLLGLVAGTMVGIALAQHRRRSAADAVRHASLTARTVADYAPKHAAWSIALATAACAGLSVAVAITAPAGLGAYAGIAALSAAAVLVVPLGRWLQRRVVEAPRGAAEPRVDDALRATAVRAVHHSVLGVLCCGIVLASLTGMLTLHTLVVLSHGHTVFRAPPGSTSISVDTSLRRLTDPGAPLEVSWIEADGSSHRAVLAGVAGDVETASSGLTGPGRLLGWMSLVVAVAAVVQWAHATSAWKRGGPPRPRAAATSAIAVPRGAA